VDRADEFAVTLETVADGTVVARVEGDLDLATSPELERTLEQADVGGRLVVDLGGCTVLDSSAIRVLAARARACAAAGGSLALVVSDPGVRRGLEIAAVDRMLELHETLDAAL
jgi:anti-sigma B factor antagonist